MSKARWKPWRTSICRSDVCSNDAALTQRFDAFRRKAARPQHPIGVRAERRRRLPRQLVTRAGIGRSHHFEIRARRMGDSPDAPAIAYERIVERGSDVVDWRRRNPPGEVLEPFGGSALA